VKVGYAEFRLFHFVAGCFVKQFFEKRVHNVHIHFGLYNFQLYFTTISYIHNHVFDENEGCLKILYCNVTSEEIIRPLATRGKREQEGQLRPLDPNNFFNLFLRI